jgi:hypothetical protein
VNQQPLPARFNELDSLSDKRRLVIRSSNLRIFGPKGRDCLTD